MTEVYLGSGGRSNYEVAIEASGVASPEVPDVLRYLAGEGLIEQRGASNRVALTHAGLVEVERAIAEPLEPTVYFTPLVHVLGDNSGTIAVNGSNVSIGDPTSAAALDLALTTLRLLEQAQSDLRGHPQETETVQLLEELAAEVEAADGDPTRLQRVAERGLDVLSGASGSALFEGLRVLFQCLV